MSGNEDSDSLLDEARRHHLKQVNGVLRRPGMYGRDDNAEWLLLEAMAAVDGSLARWFAQRDGLRERGTYTSTGVLGAYRSVLPAGCLRDATASVWAELAHRLGWLELDRALLPEEFQRMRADIGGWVTQDRTLSEVIEAFGPPSLLIGGNNEFYPKTFAYTTADRDDDLICLHLWNTFVDRPSGTGLRGVHPEPVLLAARHRPGPFPDSFSFTPQGLHRRPTADDLGPPRKTVWLFHGVHAEHASGVFATRDDGLAWAAEHQVTGILAEYPHGGAYDIAVSEGRFTPSRPHHGTADHIAHFSPGLRHLHLTGGHPD